MSPKTIRTQINDWQNGKYSDSDVQIQIDAGWYDWFCDDSDLCGKTRKLFKKLAEIANSPKFDQDKCYTFFKNNETLAGRCYDDFKIVDCETRETLFAVDPGSGFNQGYIWDLRTSTIPNEPTFVGTWGQIKNWFNSAETL